jgi:hypothetical protein
MSSKAPDGIRVEMTGAPAWVEAAWRKQASRERFERILAAARRAKVHVPERREPVEATKQRPRERRPSTRRRARAPTSDDPSPLPELEVRSYARFRRDVRRALGGAA